MQDRFKWRYVTTQQTINVVDISFGTNVIFATRLRHAY